MKFSKSRIVNSDIRGNIYDILEREQITAISIVTFNLDAVRGNHYHLKTTQWNYLHSGLLEYAVESSTGLNKGILSPGDLLRIDPNESHAFKASKESIIYVFTLGPREGKNYESDTFRLEKKLLC